MITLADVGTVERIARVVDHHRTPAWKRGALRNPPSDNVDTYAWMTTAPLAVRIQQVRTALLEGHAWSSLVTDEIDKASSWRDISRAARTSTPWRQQECRAVVHDTRIDHARQLALKDALEPLIERTLTRVAVAYRPGVSQHRAFLDAQHEIRGRQLHFASTLDVHHCFDEVPWDLLDRALERHLGSDVAAPVLQSLKALLRVGIVDRTGRAVQRDRGIPQGLVLAPLLLNLFLSDFDKAVQRQTGSLGCLLRRYSDDLLVAAPDREALSRARAIVTGELARLRLRLKPSTVRARDLRNAQNPAVWLGFAFTHTNTWVPRDRIERKAAELLRGLLDGRLDRAAVEAALDGHRKHCAAVMHPTVAERTVRSITKLLSPFLGSVPQRSKEALADIRKQLVPRSLPRTTTMPGPHQDSPNRQITLRAGQRLAASKGKTEIETADATPDDSRSDSGGVPLWTPTGGSVRRTRTCSLSSPSSVDGDVTRGRAPSAEGEGRRQRTPASLLRSSLASSFSLAASQAHRPRLPPVPDQAGHRDGPFGNSHLTEEQAPPLRAVVSIALRGRQRGTLTLEYSDGTSALEHFVVRRARSAEEVLLGGYRFALEHLQEGVGHIVLNVEHPTIAGHLHSRHRVRSPDLLRRWEQLIAVVDRMPAVVVFVEAGVGRRGSSIHPKGRSGAV
jgi:retron-type reverse transcriptase